MPKPWAHPDKDVDMRVEKLHRWLVVRGEKESAAPPRHQSASRLQVENR
jgi:hypothetical protein